MILPRVIQASLPRDSRVPERLHQRQLSYRVRRTQSSIISFSEPQNEERASGPLAAKIPIDPALVYNQPVTTKPPVDPVPARKAHAAVLPSKVSVDLSQVFNKTGIYTEGNPFDSDSSLDRVGSAFPAETLGRAAVWDGATFPLGPPNSPNAVTRRIIPLPAGRFNALKMLAMAVEGDQKSQVFTLTYADATSSRFSQSLSDWYTPEQFSGESEAALTPGRLWRQGRSHISPLWLFVPSRLEENRPHY
jgi:hypothetical protein